MEKNDQDRMPAPEESEGLPDSVEPLSDEELEEVAGGWDGDEPEGGQGSGTPAGGGG